MKSSVRVSDYEFTLVLSSDEMKTVVKGVGDIASVNVPLEGKEHEAFWNDLKAVGQEGGLSFG